MILAITGHRPHKLGGYIIPNPVANAVMLKLVDSLEVLKPEVVLSGMALGVDQWTAQICVEMQIPFDAVIAFDGYEGKWPQQSQKWYRHLLTKARQVHMLHPGPYSPSLLHQRNYWLVDHCDALLAVWDGKPGSGTAACVQYAQFKNPPKPAYRLDLHPDIWAMAQVEENTLKDTKEERARWNARFVPAPQVREVKPKPQDPGTLKFNRFIEVGEEEP